MLLKFLKAFILFISFLTIISSRSNAQYHPLLSDFDVQESNGKVYVSCIVKAGSTCLGIGLYKSLDNVVFEQAGRIPGICGNAEEPVSYEFIDTTIIYNRPVYYRLELGGFGFSESILLQVIKFSIDNYLLSPNPANTFTNIYFENKLADNAELLVLNSMGNIIHQSETTLSSFHINIESLPAGMYVFYIRKDSLEYAKGIFLKQ